MKLVQDESARKVHASETQRNAPSVWPYRTTMCRRRRTHWARCEDAGAQRPRASWQRQPCCEECEWEGRWSEDVVMMCKCVVDEAVEVVDVDEEERVDC